ncbi:MAG: AraC family transcriptional regulator [Cardiobacteriaceae bacterium]|nr:AraC family transcriptional regulator [Cardiobacteriaceae bacterium]
MKYSTLHHQQEQRFSRLLRYLQQHYRQQIDLYRLAEEARLSPYHLHRLYRKVMGETIHDTLKWTRLYQAGWLVRHTDKELSDIARATGYAGNTQSFTRIFRQQYGMTPSDYRQYVPIPYPITQMVRQPLSVGMIKHHGYCQNLGNTFYQMESLLRLRGCYTSTTRAFSIHSSTDHMTINSHAVAATLADEQITAPLEKGEIAGGTYAVLHYQGTYAELEYTYDCFHHQWLAAAGWRAANRPSIIEYLVTCFACAQQTVADICIPLDT